MSTTIAAVVLALWGLYAVIALVLYVACRDWYRRLVAWPWAAGEDRPWWADWFVSMVGVALMTWSFHTLWTPDRDHSRS
jgi:hypothetical protein